MTAEVRVQAWRLWGGGIAARLLAPQGWWRWGASAVIAALLLAVAALVFLTGGTRIPTVHAMYLPIGLAAWSFTAVGGLVAGLAAGLLLGPMMPLDVASGQLQEPLTWIARSGFFMALGTLAGHGRRRLAARNRERDRLLGRLTDIHTRVLTTFADAVEARDEQMAGHCERVGHNARVLAQAVGVGEAEADLAGWSGLLHDLGKIGVPEAILLKPGPLTAQEFALVRRHSALGANILLSISEDFTHLAAAMRAHHERFDGTGYPDRHAGHAIPLLGRILAVADVFEALTSHRPYRQPLPVDQALDYLRNGAGAHFDPDLVPHFEDLYRKGSIWVATEAAPQDWYLSVPLVLDGRLVVVPDVEPTAAVR